MAQGDAMSALMRLSMAGMGSRCIVHTRMVKRGSVFNDIVADRKETWFCVAMTSCKRRLIERFAVIDTLAECFHEH